MKRYLKRAAVISLLLVLLGWISTEIAIRTARLPSSLGYDEATLIILDHQGEFLSETGNETSRSCRPVDLKNVSPWVIRAVLAAEDKRFHEHSGIDFHALAGAVIRNIRSGKIVSGASTITQQVIKLNSGKSSRGWSEKISENFSALRLEREWSKDRILRAYLNRIDYGNRIRGIEAAARIYFGKSAAILDPAEAVFLAGLPQAPSRYNPRAHPEAAEARYRQLLRYLGMSEDPAFSKVPTLIAKTNPTALAPHFSRVISTRSSGKTGVLRTTLDAELQGQVEAIVARHSKRLEKSHASQIAVLVMDHQSGAVRAWCGSSAWSAPRGQIDGVLTPRSSGSTLKPFLYLRAIDEKILSAATLLPDTPDAIRAEYLDYDPRNYDERFWGPVRAREALANSLNVPAVFVLAKLGARDFYNYLARSGIPLKGALDDYGAGMILGNGEVRMIDLAAAFGAFANQGVHVSPRFSDTDPIRHAAISSPQAAAVVCDILSDNDARLKTFGASSPLAFESTRVPCKTGTSSGFHDAWTVGATGRHTVAVWVGNFDGRAMDEVASVTGPAPVWREIIDLLLPADGGVKLKTDQPGLVTTEICNLSGLRPTADSRGKMKELFLTGTEPTADASAFFENGQVVLPPEYALWCRSGHNYLSAKVTDRGPLRIVNPLDGSTYLTDPGLPISRQRIELLAIGEGDGKLRWEVDGKPLDPDGGGGFFWPVTPGKHHLKAISPNAATEANFEVK